MMAETVGSINLVVIGAVIALLTPIVGCAVSIFKVWNRFHKLEKQAAYRQEDTAMIFLCLRGCLEGLVEQGCNGPVKDALRTLNTYTDNKAAGLTGAGKHTR